jgi:BirA family biotin operon repressor/biotin-[acetyl-CoA-carboxylase] ligase
MISKEELISGLETKAFGKKIFVYETLDSTNACAKALADTGAPEGTVVISEHQTAGRGRQGRSWHSQPGHNLLFSVILRPGLEKDKAGLLPFFAAYSAALAIEQHTGSKCECKWPNDIMINGKKCCGILMENCFQSNSIDFTIAGIGLNINQENFPVELKNKATSLKSECGRGFDRPAIFRQIMRTMESVYSEFISEHSGNILEKWKSHANMFGKNILIDVSGRKISGKAVDLSANGGLILDTPEGRKVFYSGDVTVAEISGSVGR